MHKAKIVSSEKVKKDIKTRPSNPIVNDSKQQSQLFIIYHLLSIDSVAIVNDNSVI